MDRGEVLRFGRYELLFEIGSGGMARVYLARQSGDSGFERLVAVKRVHDHLVGDPDIYSMVSDEARIAALLSHPNVVSVVDVVDRKGELLLVLDYVEGFSLSKLFRNYGKALPPALASRIVVDALMGLHAAHEARDLLGERLEVVHRDVSPQNLLVGTDGVTRVIDFGIARARGNATLTQTGVVKGKVAYMAPERLEEKAVDRRSDLFAMGAVLNELLRGESAKADRDEARDIARALLATFDPRDVEAIAPKLAPVLERALARSPSDRYANAEEMCRAVAIAEPPAPPSEIAAWVASLEEEAIAERRSKVRAAVHAVAVAETDPAEPEGHEAPILPSGSVQASEPDRPEARAIASGASSPSRRPLPWIVLGVAGILASNVAVWMMVRPRAESDAVAASTARAPAAPPVDSVTLATSSVAQPSARLVEPGAPAAASSPLPRASTPSARALVAHPSSSATSGLHADPYASAPRP
jgi:serine/threonine protein kinase